VRSPLTRRGLLAASLTAPGFACAAPLAPGDGAADSAADAARAALAAAGDATRLVILGAGGGESPKPHRRMTSHLMVSGGAAYVVDCGLGVTYQLARAGLAWPDLRAIFITHHHPDHNIEYGPLLVIGWLEGMPASVRTFGPPPLRHMTEGFLAAWRTTIDVWAEDFRRPPLIAIEVVEITAAGPVMADARVKVTAAIVNHPPVRPALGYRFDFADRSIAFSGDTTPLEAVARLAHGADVLVHEAILMDRMEAWLRTLAARGVPGDPAAAMAHMRADHSPVEAVGRIAAEAGVRTLVLSHLVPGVDSVDDEAWRAPAARHFKGEILVARDLMVV
jgi:ribonuclease BN (tRNA processing enzyme)